MSEQERQQQEYEFVMEGITTRMQIAMDKLSENNKSMRNIIRWVCVFALVMTFMTVFGMLLTNKMWMVREARLNRTVSVSEVVADEEIPQLRSGQGD